jgi:hypothetical protein
MKIHRFTILAALFTSPAFAQTNTYPFPSSGNVGIGTTSPSETLHLSSSQSASLGLEKVGANTARIFNDGSLHIRSGSGITYHDSNYHIFSNFSGTAQLMIDPNGSIGVGTGSPVAKLDINVPNSANVSDGLVIERFSGASLFGFKLKSDSTGHYRGAITVKGNGLSEVEALTFGADLNSGNVGIGTTSPTRKLTVQGDALFSDGERGSLIAHDSYNGGRAFLVLDKNSQNGTASGSDYVYLAQEGTQAVLTSASGTPLNLGSGATSVSIAPSGNVGIGTTNPTHKLAVNGTIKAKEVIVETTGWSDYVFADDYALQPLSQVEAHIKEHKHLPGIPSASTVASQGVNVGDMQAALLAKVEELTLHLIAQEKELSRLRDTEKKLATLESKLQQLQQSR